MDPLTQTPWLLRSGANQTHQLPPPVHNLRMISPREALTEADIDFHEARVPLKTFEATGPSGDTRDLYTANYLHEHKAVVHGWYEQVSKYKVNASSRVGKGYQGVVYNVHHHPDKVVKRYPVMHTMKFHALKQQFRYDQLASDKKFGPNIYEVSSDYRVIDISNRRTFPPFYRGMVISVVMEKLHCLKSDAEAIHHYVGIIEAWKKMKKNGLLNVDGLFGYSSQKKLVFSADYGGVDKTPTDKDFIYSLSEYLKDQFEPPFYAEPLKKYVQDFPQDPFVKDILEPVLTNV